MPSFFGKLQWKCEISDKEIVYKRMKIGIQFVREREIRKRKEIWRPKQTQPPQASSWIMGHFLVFL